LKARSPAPARDWRSGSGDLKQPYAIRFHPAVRDDLEAIAEGIAARAGHATAERKLVEIAAAIRTLADTPHKGSIRDTIAPGLRAIPAARRGVVAFTVDDASSCVTVQAIVYGGADWAGRAARRR
jgi:plasmid stabilization system protein ParE